MFDYEHIQLEWWLEANFVIVRGPPLAGKSTAVKSFFSTMKLPYIIINAKTLKNIDDIANDLKKTIHNHIPSGSIEVMNGVKNIKTSKNTLDSILYDLPEGTYIVFDNADFLSLIKEPYPEYPLEVFQEFIDATYHHFIFVPRITPKLITYLGPKDYSSPLFMRYEKYVDVVPLSPTELCNFLSIDDWNCVRKYSILGGLKGATIAYKKLGDHFSSFIHNYVVETLSAYYPEDYNHLLEVFNIIAHDTRITDYSYVPGESLDYLNKYRKTNITKEDVQKLIDIDFVYELNGRIIARKPLHLFSNKTH